MSYIIGGHSGGFALETTDEEGAFILQNWISDNNLQYLGIRLHQPLTDIELDTFAINETNYIQLGRIDGILTFIFY